MPQLNDPGGGGHYHPHAASNGHHSDGASPSSSQLSVDGRESTLITRTQKQHVTQNVSPLFDATCGAILTRFRLQLVKMAAPAQVLAL